jgi:hypothetical protein
MLLLALRQNSGPILVGMTHQGRLAQIALEIDPNFLWEQNYFRRTCISFYIGAFGQKAYYAEQAGHDEKVQKKRYLRPVDKEEALQYVAYSPDPEWVKTLPYAATDAPPARGRRPKPEVPFVAGSGGGSAVPVAGDAPVCPAMTGNGDGADIQPPGTASEPANQPVGNVETSEAGNRPAPETKPKKTRTKPMPAEGGPNTAGAEVKKKGPYRKPPSQARIQWPPVNVFFRLMWSEPATHIATSLQCSQASVLMLARKFCLEI